MHIRGCHKTETQRGTGAADKGEKEKGKGEKKAPHR